MTGHGYKLLEVSKMDEIGWKWLEMARNGWKWLEWLDVAGNDWKLLQCENLDMHVLPVILIKMNFQAMALTERYLFLVFLLMHLFYSRKANNIAEKLSNLHFPSYISAFLCILALCIFVN